MADFDYNEYRKFEDSLNAYYESVGFDSEKVWDIHDELDSLYWDFNDAAIEDFDGAKTLINSFVENCKCIKDAFLYPICMQECLQVLIMIATYPVSEGEEYDEIIDAAESAVSGFHTHISHDGM